MTVLTSDIQQVFSKTQAVERLYHTHKQQPDADQQKFAATIQQKFLDKNEKTQEMTEAENRKIENESQEKSVLDQRKKNKKKKKNTAHNKNEETEMLLKSNVGQIIDIKV